LKLADATKTHPKMTDLSYPAEQVRLYDHDRFITALFAPQHVREHLFALYAFNIEIAKTGEVVSEPLIGQMRLQWWRDTLDRLYAGQDVAHGVARPLGAAISACGLARAHFDRLIDARESDLDKIPPADFPALLFYADGTGAPLVSLALQLVSGGVSTPAEVDAAHFTGSAWALTGLLRAVPFHAGQRRLYLPADRLAAAGVRTGRLFDLKPEPGLTGVVRDIADTASVYLQNARIAKRAMPLGMRSPLLIAELARLYLADLKRCGWDPFLLERKRPRALIAANLGVRAMIGRY
jgi:phytoene synthase